MDDGVGFDLDGVTSDRMGVCNMRERAEAIGGEFVINTAEGEGTQITIEVHWTAGTDDPT
jgi:signal transduction histidine kinase